MLFVVIDHIRIQFENADKTLAQITKLKQTFDMYDDLKARGKLKFSYMFADTPGGITLWEVESNEELQRILFLLPSMPLVERTVKPLTEMKSALNVMKELALIVSSMSK
jgi:muconolactone D-isomerase